MQLKLIKGIQAVGQDNWPGYDLARTHRDTQCTARNSEHVQSYYSTRDILKWYFFPGHNNFTP